MILPSSRNPQHSRRVLIPLQHRILPAQRPRILRIRPPLQKLLLAHDPREFAGDGRVHVFHDVEIAREEDIEVALLDLFNGALARG